MTYMWSKRKAIVHTARCRWARRIKAENLQQARDLEEALADGRRGCRLCKPVDGLA